MRNDLTTETEDDRWERLSRDRIVRPLPKKFYKLATVTDELCIALDGRVVKTPMKAKLVLPSLKLAQAVAGEWNAQAEFIDPASMPITKLANTAIDRAGGERKFVAGQVVEYAGSDMVCYRAEAPSNLVALQAAAWNPIVAWAKAAMGTDFKVVSGIIHNAQDGKTIAAVETYIKTLSDFELTIAHNLTTLTGSALLALMATAGQISADVAWAAAHVEEDFQIATWGKDDEAEARRAFRRIDFEGSLAFLNFIRA
jgi:chaperone required for assembly of F1-ATPase